MATTTCDKTTISLVSFKQNKLRKDPKQILDTLTDSDSYKKHTNLLFLVDVN